MFTVESADGTTIAIDSTGRGSALVIVVGAFCDRRTGGDLVAALAEDYRVFVYDRCGRGDSGNHPDIATRTIQREVEDLAAVLAAAAGENGAAGPAFVYGHSSGGAIALEAAAQGIPMRRLAVYEPPYVADGTRPDGFAQHLRELVAAGDPGAAAEQFLALTGAPPAAIAGITASPYWSTMVSLAPTLANDVEVSEHGSGQAGWLADVAVPTLVMAGGGGSAWAVPTAHEVAGRVTDGRALTLAGQDHNPAVDVVAPVLVEFFRAGDGAAA